jgi:hypothetical protein
VEKIKNKKTKKREGLENKRERKMKTGQSSNEEK